MTNLKCPHCSSNHAYELPHKNDEIRCANCSYVGDSHGKRKEAVASVSLPPTEVQPDAKARIEWLETEVESYKKRLEAAAVANQKREREIIGLKQEVAGLKTCIAKLKAIRKELRNLVDMYREAK